MPLRPPPEASLDALDTPDGLDRLDEEELSVLDALWRAANHLAVGQIHLMSNPLLTEPLAPEHVKPRLLGHWDTSPGLNLVHTSCYEAFVHIVGSMATQHIKWLRVARRLPWRRPIASLNYLLTSHMWRQDNNGFSYQDPGFVDHVLNRSPEVVQVYYPPDANTLLSVADHVLRSRDYFNVVVAGKQPCFDWLDLDAARAHCTRGAGIWTWAGTGSDPGEPGVVLACAGDVPTLEVLAAASVLRHHLPELAVRVVNVVDIARLLPAEEHLHGVPDSEYDALFIPDKPVVFAYHGYPVLIHRLAYCRANHPHLHVRGYKEEGTTTTPFDMVVRNDLDRHRLGMDVVDRMPGLAVRAAALRQRMVDVRSRCHDWIPAHGEDLSQVAEWTWSQ